MKKEDKTKILSTIIVLSFLGLLTSIYLIKDHYSTEATICDFNAKVSCSLVNTSVFSEILNVPVAVLGALWFILLIALSWKALKKDGVLLAGILGWNIIGILFVVYFIIAEIILRAICPLCTLVHLIVLITLILSIILYQKQEEKPPWKKIMEWAKPWLVVIVIINIIPLLIFNFPAGEKENFDNLTKCLTESGVKMYSSFRCGVCAKTKSMLGNSFRYIKEIECHPQGEKSQTELCLEKGISGTPTWILEQDGVEQKRQQGFMSIEELREFSGCEV